MTLVSMSMGLDMALQFGDFITDETTAHAMQAIDQVRSITTL